MRQQQHCKYDPFIYKGEKYLVDWFPTKSTVCGITFKSGFITVSGEIPISQVIWVAVNYMHEIEEVFETLEI